MLIKLNVLALTTDEGTGKDLAAILAGMEGVVLHSRSLTAGQLTTSIDATTNADVMILESDGSDLEQATEVETFTASLPESVATFVVGDASNSALLRRLMRAGVRDVLARPVVRQDVINAITAVLSEKRARAMARGENVMSICAFLNAKGGSGATLLAVNMAASLAARHKARVALLDFDMQFGECALMLDLAPQNNMGDALRQADRIDGFLLKALMTEHAGGVHVLAAPSSPSAAINLDAHAVRRVIDAAASEYDIVILDLPRVVAPWTIEALRAATTTFLVVQNNLSTIRDARLLGDHLPRAGIDSRRIQLINNRAMAKTPSVSIEQMKKTLKYDKVHRIRNDYKTAAAAGDQGLPVHKVDPHSHLSTDIDNLADHIWEAHGHGAIEKKQKHLTKKDVLIEKFFGAKVGKSKKAK